MKKTLIIILIILAIVLTPILVASVPWLLMAGISVLEPNPPKPEITYAEFPFRIEYRIADKNYVIEDTVICEYDGMGWNEGRGKHREWKKYFKKSSQEDLVIFTDGDIKICCSVGSARYYMDDEKYPTDQEYAPTFYCIYPIGAYYDREELLKKYDIELIDWQLSKPIKNSFN